MKKIGLILFAAFISFSAALYAEQTTVPLEDETAVKKEPVGFIEGKLDSYWEQSAAKLDHATPNLFLGWTEVGTRAVDNYRKDGSRAKKSLRFWGGAGEGLLRGAWNTAGGAIDAVTFLLPVFRTPLPDGGVNLKRAALTA